LIVGITTYRKERVVNQAKYIGMDVHQAAISVAVMDSVGKLILESILETKAATILQFVGGLRAGGPPTNFGPPVISGGNNAFIVASTLVTRWLS
jgi:hypothetical protein